MRFATTLLLCLSLFAVAPLHAQPPKPGEFHEAVSGLILRYPVEMIARDPEKALTEGHIAAFGSMRNAAKDHELAVRCIRPLLISELPVDSADLTQSWSTSASLFFFEFFPTKECISGFKYKDEDAVAGGLAQAVIQLPGATSLMRPLYFDYGKERFHAAVAAFGMQQSSNPSSPALVTMSAMRYHGHIFGWIASADHLNTFNQLTKSSVQLDDGKAYPLLPFNFDDHLQLPANVPR